MTSDHDNIISFGWHNLESHSGSLEIRLTGCMWTACQSPNLAFRVCYPRSQPRTLSQRVVLASLSWEQWSIIGKQPLKEVLELMFWHSTRSQRKSSCRRLTFNKWSRKEEIPHHPNFLGNVHCEPPQSTYMTTAYWPAPRMSSAGSCPHACKCKHQPD